MPLRVHSSVRPSCPSAATFVAHFSARPPGPTQSAIVHRITTLSHIARMTAAGEAGSQATAELARLKALQAKESSRWLRALPVDAGLRLTDLQWQTAVQLRLGMPRAPHGVAGQACEHDHAAAADGWHALLCLARSGPAINARHHAVVRLLSDAAALLKIPARIEPYHLSETDDSRPDMQLDLPEYSLLVDVTVSHPNAERWRNAAADRGVEAVGAARSAEKDDHYVPLAQELGVRFTPFVLYTYGGFHKSALSTIAQLGAAYDPAVSLVSLSAWKQELKDRIAVCVQRHTANIVIEDDRRARAAGVLPRRRRPGRRAAVRRPRLIEPPLRRRVAEREQHGQSASVVGRRAASLCAALLSPVPARLPVQATVPEPPAAALPPASASPAADAVIPGTPGMEVGSADEEQAGAGAEDYVCAMSALSVSPICMEVCAVYVDEVEPAGVMGDAAARVAMSDGVASMEDAAALCGVVRVDEV